MFQQVHGKWDLSAAAANLTLEAAAVASPAAADGRRPPR